MMKKYISALIIALAVGVLFSFMYNFGLYETWQLRLSDMLYAERPVLDDIVIIAIDDKSLQEIGRWPWPREEYIKLVPKLEQSKVVGIDIAFFEEEENDYKLASELRKLNAVLPVQYDFEKNTVLKPVDTYYGIDTGFVNIINDADGIVRDTYLLIDDIEVHKSFAFTVYEKFRGKEIEPDFDKIIINYAGKPGSFTLYSFSDAVAQDIDFADKIVLIGATAPSLHDEFFTPISEGKAMSGVEINANIIQTLITKNYIARQSASSTIVLIMVFSILAGLAMGFLKLRWSTIAIIALLAAYLFFALYMFDKNNIIMNIVYPFAVLLFTYVALTAFFYFSEQKERKKIHDLFGKYVSKDVADEIISKSKSGVVDLQGEEREISVLFADIRNFTPTAEKMKPHAVVNMLNTNFGKMTDAVLNNKGTLDKYMGDCVMALFGAPLKNEQHALDAVKAALEMKQAVKEIHKQKNVPKVGIGIGINSGEAVIGNMGSTKRAEYTAIGDTVNIASRLCSNSNAGQVIVSEQTFEKIKNKVKAKSLGHIKVKGKKKPVKVYEIIGLK
ncbi:CHASE2 domain-containing protein [Candidatus Woesearchaeota archaeon]|nr:CHASE2 domain-containing protein [Candidatus Woesearchaeota archaeon]